MVTAAVAAVSPTTADAAEEIPETTADAGKEGSIRSRHPEAHADVRKNSPK